MSREIVFVKYGSFSLVNERVEAMLRQQFPDRKVVILDAAKDILSAYPLRSLWLRIKTVLAALPAFLHGRHSQWDFVFRRVQAWEMISRWIAKEIDPAKTDFIFQTQGMFDSSLSSVPFFIYTDHTRRAHRHQSGGGAPASVGPGWEVAEERLYHKADAIFTLSRFCEDSLVSDYEVPREKVLTVSTGINIDFPEEVRIRDRSKPVVLFVGVEWEVKGGPELLAAFADVKKQLPAVELWIVGCKPAGLPPGVTCLGRVDPKRMAQLFAEASVLCVPSRIERASMVALDAAAHGLPVITTPHGAGSERVRDGLTGLLVDPQDTLGFSSAILHLLKNPDLAEEMGRAGRRMVEQDFTWSSVGSKIANRIRSTVHGLS
jgi:glycosyltransferase involved in cell wall biosynthesis